MIKKFHKKMIVVVSLLMIAGFMMPMHYINSSYKANNITTGTNNTYPIYLSNLPKGNGTYQQLITINNYSKYGINNKGSNIEFFDSSNYTHLYAWIQSINATSMQIWIKNYNESNIIDMQVFPSFENLFSAIGYLGYGEEYFNAQDIFVYATDFTNLSDFTVISGSPKFVSNGVNLSDSEISSNSKYNISSYRFIWNWTTSIISTSNYNYVGFVSVNGTSYVPPYYSLYNIVYYLNQNNTGTKLHQFTTELNGTNTYEIYGNSKEAYYIFNNQNPYTFGNIYYNPMPLNFAVDFAFSSGTVIFHYFIVERNITIPIFTIGKSLYHSIDFKLIGSSISFQWSISINGTIYNATSSNFYLNMTNGYYNIIVNLPAGYSAITKGVLYVNGTNQVYKIFVSYNNNSGFSNDIIYAIILASIIVAAAIYFSKRS